MKPPPVHRAAAIALLVLAAIHSIPARAQSCEPRFAFKYADGATGCLGDFELVDNVPAGRSSSVRRIAPSSGSYNIAAASPAHQCPLALGFAMTRLNTPGQNNPDNLTRARSAKALAECSKALADAKPSDPSCSCTILYEDGTSPMTQAAFADYVGTARAAK